MATTGGLEGWLGLAVLAAGMVVSGPAGALERLAGTATCQDPVALPPDAVFEAVIEDVSRADVPAPVIGRVLFQPAGQLPIRFEIPYDPARLEPGHRYSVRARVMQGDTLLLITTRHHPVLAPGSPATVDVLLERLRAQFGPGEP